MSKKATRPCKEIEVVPKNIPSNYDENRINVNDSFISFANLPDQSRVELQSQGPIFSTNGAQKIVINDDLEITFHRTLRMPDDKRLHQLPASLGHFALFNVEEYADRLSPNITEQGGLFFPMWQREAMWMGFSIANDQQEWSFDGTRHRCTYALRIFVGHINAVSGSPMGEKLPNVSHEETKQDYVVVPQQRWVDGICVAPGVVRQFVAMPRKCISLFSYVLHGAFKGICTSFPSIDVIVVQDNSFKDGTYKPTCGFAMCHCG